MRIPAVAFDIGDVLVSTRPDRQFARLEHLSGVDAGTWKQIVDGDHRVGRLEEGAVPFEAFAADVCARAGVSNLPLPSFESAWNEAIGPVDEAMASVASVLARQERLVFASNTSAPHWLRTRALLADAGVRGPACLSHVVGARKPSAAFFTALHEISARHPAEVIFVDDRGEHVAAAREHGFRAIHHLDAATTITALERFL